MKSILVIGMGRFGCHLAQKMLELGDDVMIVDKSEEKINQLSPTFTDSFIGDCTKEGVLRSLGVNNFDICFVTMRDSFQASLETTSLLKELGARHVVSIAGLDRQADFLKKIGADDAIYPEKEIAENLAVRYHAKNIFDYLELTSEFSIYEIPILPEWAGSTVGSINVRQKYRVNIIAIKHDNKLDPLPGAEYTFDRNDHIVVIGKSGDVFRLSDRT